MIFNRFINMIGEERFNLLKTKSIIVFGLGGVGSYAAEVLVRSGIHNLTVVDYDMVDITNINRQLIALQSTLGMKKVDVFYARAKDINPDIIIKALQIKVKEENIKDFFNEKYDYVIDCVDDIIAKVEIAKFCLDNKINLISSMGFANKSHPEQIKIAKLNQTKVCPLARSFRKKIKELGYPLDFKVVYSEEKPSEVIDRKILGSNAYCPSAAGIILASEVINHLLKG
ncbi:MAG: tRNA threonylcarbamoyladenosine dehydratase [Candidatus Izemoplasmatales bacterium]